jgi:hypothetical protein
MPRHPDQDNLHEQAGKDYNTGRAKLYAEVNLTDRLPHEPTAIRAQAEQVNGSDWIVRTTHGPHAEKDATGSYYRTVNSEVMHGVTPAKMKTHVRRAAKGAHNDLLKQRPRDAG